ncbi:MAG: thymidine phosphorylase [Ruminococcus sp.]|nr:thymidine phosphorylase [Ruminococcus sp.]
MNMYELITKKKRGGELNAEEIAYFVKGYVDGTIPDYQAAALVMSIWFNSMTERETVLLTQEMEHSGDTLSQSVGGFTADKHSTGGVGDKTTLIVGPIAAACGIFVPKMSGRGLGHTGGTIDKLEAIPGFNTALSAERFEQIVRDCGFAIAGQTGKLVPADKKLYALRDSIAAVDSIPLICSSIMSKKLATGADGIVLDIKTGDGAFMKSYDDAVTLAELMVKTAKAAGRKCSAVISDMEQPLGMAVGNSLEVIEAIEALKGRGDSRLRELSLTLAAEMLCLSGKGTPEECRKAAEEALDSGRAFDVFRRTVKAQGGNTVVFDDYGKFPQASAVTEVRSPESGYITHIQCEETGLIACSLGAGRTELGGKIDSTAGIVFAKTVGDHVEKGEVLGRLYSSSADEKTTAEAVERFAEVFSFSPDRPVQESIVRNVLR